MASTCRSCGAAIVWALTVTGKRAPFTEDPAGIWIIVDGKAVTHFGEHQRYTSHFANCPQASQWRGAR